MNSTPLVWSISCWRQVASRPLALISCALAVEIEILDLHLGRPLDLLVIFRDRQAAFLVGRFFVRRPGDLRIDEDLRLVIVLLLRQVHGDDALGARRAGSPRARCRAPSYMVSNMSSTSLRMPASTALDRLGLEPQPLVGKLDDFAQIAMALRCKACVKRGQCSAFGQPLPRLRRGRRSRPAIDRSLFVPAARIA